MYYFCATFLKKLFKYILFIERNETFWPRDATGVRELAHFEFKTHKDF